MEEWRDIPGWEGYYQVSDHGRVRSVDREVIGINGVPQYHRARIRKQGLSNIGYLGVVLCRNNHRSPLTVHKLVARAFLGEPLLGQEVRHIDGTKTNNHVSNLCWGTHQDNIHDAILDGVFPRGVKNGLSKLTETEILAIRADPRTQQAIADDYGISQGNVGYIKRRGTWKHI